LRAQREFAPSDAPAPHAAELQLTASILWFAVAIDIDTAEMLAAPSL